MRTNLDWPILLAYLMASAISLVVIGSISPDRIVQQAIMLLLGLALLVYISRQEIAVYTSFAPILYFFANIMLALTLVIATVTRGTLSWVELAGFRFQPSEFTKPLLILSFAYFIERFPPTKINNILLNLLIFVLPTSLIFIQPDLGTALVISIVWVLQMFIANIPWGYIIASIIALIGSVPLLPFILRDYQLSRLTSFLNPYSDPLNSGYNVIQSIIAVGSGGILGKGLGHGTQSHLRFLPERHTDFIFASLAEELGMLGSTMIIVVMAILVFRLLTAATVAKTQITRLILSGTLAYLAFQAFINIGMNLGVLPVTGVTLPLISYGGSSILATSIILGVASSAIRASSNEKLIEIR
ncbi:MAG: rod shape-determining protein RodA [Candidatus Moraniibacteriota bacterium]|nr:MAG: rod shape-determining protein RodA [Candidatus Moranbacteria bacterium]